MNLDILKKLVKLANHNPNEHEANSAARRVCKMIEADNFKFIPDESITQRTANDSTSTVGFENLAEMLRKMRMHQDAAKQNAAWTKSSDPFRVRNPFVGVEYSDGTYIYYNPTNEKRILICKKCKQSKETRFRGLPETWMCMECRGAEFKI